MPLRTILSAALAVALACPAMAQDKKTVGTVTSMEAGDVACYLTLRDDAGQRFREMADFEICEQKTMLLNKRVNLTYRRSNVLADECAGNPECKKSKSVMLVVAATPVAAAATTPASHCAAGDTVVFHCSTGAKAVSVCAAGNSLQYRFGKLGDAPEISVPDGKVAAAQGATGEIVAFSGGGGAWLRFTRGGTSYVVYDGIGNWGPGGAKKEIAGIAVESGGKRTANVKCAARPRNGMSPELFQRLGLKPGSADFDFPTDD